MATTQNTYTGDNSTVSYSFTFPYLEETDIKVSLDGVVTTAYSLSNATTVTFNTAPGTGVAIRIYRDTNNDELAATFFAGSAIRAQDLNDDFLQNAYVTQEVKNRYLDKSTGGTITGDVAITGDFDVTGDTTLTGAVDVTGASSFTGNVGITGTLDMNANRILDVGTPTAGTDAVNKTYVDAYINTVYQGPLAADPATRTGGSALQEGDLYFNTVEDILKAWTGTEWVISAAAGNIVRWRKTAAGGETSLSGNDDSGSALSYQAGNEQVFLNGVLQQRGVDYTAGTGTSIDGLTALTAGDIVELHAVQGYVSATVTDGSITSAKIADNAIVNADVNSSAGIVATKLSFTQSGTGATERTVESKLKDVVSVKDFGAVGDNVTDDTDAFNAAITASNYVLIPAGTYKISTQINLTGNKTIIGMSDANGYRPLVSKINFTGASGNCFSATSAEFGGITIKNIWIVGGNGSYAIRSSRPQSVFENIYMEEFNGGGIELFEAGTGSQASWSTMIKNCKWVPPVAANNYRGYQIDINGGHVTLEGCVAARGAIGLNIDQGEAINVYRCSFNVQNSTYSSEADVDTAAIRLSGADYKKAISIHNCYIEACTHGIYAEKCESLSIKDNYLADVGFGANRAEIYLKDNNIKNVTIKNNNFADAASGKSSIEIGDGAQNVVIENNLISNTGANGFGIKKGATTYSWIKNNDITVNVYTGTKFSDPNRLLVKADYQQNGFANYKFAINVPHTTWTDIGAVGNNQIWQIIIADRGTPSTWHRQDTLFIDGSGTATFKNIFNVNPGYATRELQVSSGILQFRVTGVAYTTSNTITAIRLA